MWQAWGLLGWITAMSQHHSGNEGDFRQRPAFPESITGMVDHTPEHERASAVGFIRVLVWGWSVWRADPLLIWIIREMLYWHCVFSR